MAESPGPEQPEPDHVDPDHVDTRADGLLPEEKAVGSDDPQAQAAAILAESEARTLGRDDPTGKPLERRTSEDTVEPADSADGPPV